MLHGGGLLAGVACNLLQKAVNLFGVIDHIADRVSSLLHHDSSCCHLIDAGGDQGADFAGRLCAAMRQTAHFAGYHGKTTARLASSGCLNGRVERQDVGLKSDAIDHAGDVTDS